MIILHVSDTHGVPPEPKVREDDYDVVVHSGDLLPNVPLDDKALLLVGRLPAVERQFQEMWLEENAEKFPKYGGKPVVFVPGNHDYIDPTPRLREAGLDVAMLVDSAMEIGGARFWGHPWTTPFCDWNYMLGHEAMAEKTRRVRQAVDHEDIDVLISHGPMLRVLDKNALGQACGCPYLRAALASPSVRSPLRLLLHGHIHESPGLVTWPLRRTRLHQPLLVSNAARTERTIALVR